MRILNSEVDDSVDSAQHVFRRSTSFTLFLLQADEENLPGLQQHQYSYRINGRKTKGIMGRRRQMHCVMLGRPSKSQRAEERKQQMFGICT